MEADAELSPEYRNYWRQVGCVRQETHGCSQELEAVNRDHIVMVAHAALTRGGVAC